MVIAHDGALADAPAMAGYPDPLPPVATTACAVTPPAAAPVSVSVSVTGMAADAVANIQALMTGAGDGATEIAPTAQGTRLELLGLMTAAGWDFYRSEWWHYQLFDARTYAVLADADLPEGIM